jgi:hypothetical protein
MATEEPAAVVRSVEATANAADFGRQFTAAAAPGTVRSMMTSTASSLTKIAVALNSLRKRNGTNSRSSMTTSPLTRVMPDAATCRASAA